MFDTFSDRYLINYIIMTSNLSFHDFLQTFSCTQLKMLTSGKKPVYFLILSCYFIDFRLKLLCAKFALHWTNMKVISWKENSNGSPIPNFFNLKKGQSFQSQILEISFISVALIFIC